MIGHIQREPPGRWLCQHRSDRLIIHTRNIPDSLVPPAAGSRSQVCYSRQKIRIRITKLCRGTVVRIRDRLLLRFRDFVQQIIRKFTASVRCIHRGETGDIRSDRRFRKSCSHVKPAFGVGYNIQFFIPVFPNDPQDTLFQLAGAVIDARRRLVFPVINHGAVPHQLIRNSAPVVKMLEIPEKDSMHQ